MIDPDVAPYVYVFFRRTFRCKLEWHKMTRQVANHNIYALSFYEAIFLKLTVYRARLALALMISRVRL